MHEKLWSFVSKTEEKVLSQSNQRFARFEQDTEIPSPQDFRTLQKNWSMDVEEQKRKNRLNKLNQSVEKITSLGASYIASCDIKNLFEKTGKTPFVVSGSSKSNWELLSEDEKDKISQTMMSLVSSLDPNKYIIVTGGTDYGVEKIIHDNCQNIEVLGVLTEEASLSEIQNPNISYYTIAQGNWYAKSSYVMDNILKPHNGKVLFAAGGSIVSDEILSCLYHNLTPQSMFLLKDVGGASSSKAKQNPDFAISDFSDILPKLCMVSPKNVREKIANLRNNQKTTSPSVQATNYLI